VAGEDGVPNSNFSKIPALSETSRVRKLIFAVAINTPRDSRGPQGTARDRKGPGKHHKFIY